MLEVCNVSGPDDIYRTEHRLSRAIFTLQNNLEVVEENRNTILDYVISMKAQGIKSIRLSKSIYMLRDMSNIIQKPFSIATKQDIEYLMFTIEQRSYAFWTKSDYKIILKRFYKWLLGDDETAPKIVSWIKIKDSKSNILPEELLTEEEVLKLVDTAKFTRDKAFIYLLYESGARIGEMLTLKIKHITFGEKISSILVNGKTGQRRIPIIKSVPYLKEWIKEHPFGEDSESSVWCKMIRRNQQGRGPKEIPSYSVVRKTLNETFKKSNIGKKSNPHLFRHSRATYLANHLTEAQLKQFFGWTQASDMASRYVHLSGRDLDSAILNLGGGIV